MLTNVKNDRFIKKNVHLFLNISNIYLSLHHQTIRE